MAAARARWAAGLGRVEGQAVARAGWELCALAAVERAAAPRAGQRVLVQRVLLEVGRVRAAVEAAEAEEVVEAVVI